MWQKVVALIASKIASDLLLHFRGDGRYRLVVRQMYRQDFLKQIGGLTRSSSRGYLSPSVQVQQHEGDR